MPWERFKPLPKRHNLKLIARTVVFDWVSFFKNLK